jgi:hypothetical protein
MATNGDQPGPTGRKAKISTLIGRVMERADVWKVLKTLSSRGPETFFRTQQGLLVGAEQNMMKASEYLEICQENVLDAYTVEDALYWHNEIINELSIELNLLTATRWPQTVKASMAAVLEDRLDQHALAVTNLAAVLEKNEPVRWQP